ncbi:SDR family oxidoreductase [Oligoflexus tunisiensis]|uniref:SDR family oxidoreductase n=1 Tax=Oligoflexus tunisiensis TaxID=708132 RepID=UPI000A48D180|nr:SDR family oxidoreductase [Oligoflexus tunisiensis]
MFAGRQFIVTGGGSGIGRCIAHELSALGAMVHIVGRNEEKLRTVCNEIEADGGSARPYVCDIRDEALVVKTVAEIVQSAEHIHGLVNNAGGQFPAPLSHISQKGFEAVVRTNLVGGFLVAREVFNQSMSRHGGSIVNITADNWGGMPGMGHSGAARAGMDNFTKTAAVEWAHRGVRVNAVAPGWIASSGMDTYDKSIQALLPTMKAGVPLKRLGTEAEISSAVCFLLSDGARYINGATLRVDGGSPLGGKFWPLAKAENNQAYDGFHRSKLPDAVESLD